MVALLAAASMAGVAGPVAARAPVPKVAIVVGPVGALTSTYRSLADEAARAAEAAGARVVRAYSPNATWPAVEEAVTGASIVVYLGHGNGWPSIYRDELYPPTQNGFGLNPVAGVDDLAHQYFGERHVATLHFAPNAVVVLSHLCYASGNSEPGLAEGTRDQAIQRVDNYAAGFIAAGARAVIAEGHMAPAYYVRSLLTANGTVASIWRGSPTAHGHELAAGSVRSPGYTARLDPDRESGGYYRSLVTRGSLTAAAVRGGAAGARDGGATSSLVTAPDAPSLADLGLQVRTPVLRGLPVAGTTTRLTLPLAVGQQALIPAGTRIGVRWDPILVDAVAQPDAVPDAGVATPVPDAASPSPSPTASPASSPAASTAPGSIDPAADRRAGGPPTPTPTPEPSPSATPPAEPPAVELVVPEQTGDVVTLGRARPGSKGIVVDVTLPTAPGLYRLVPTLHGQDDVAYDAATQALLTPLLVRVGGPFAVAYGAPAGLIVAPGAETALAVRVVNAGSKRWDLEVAAPWAIVGEGPKPTTTQPARLVATWVSTAGQPVPDAVGTNLAADVAGPGGRATARLTLVAPAEPGSYLLVLDVLSPAAGPLSAAGSAPAIVRVEVASPAAP